MGDQGARDFSQDVWQRRIMVFPTDPTTLGDCWMTAEDIDRLVTSVDFPTSNLDLADGTQPLPKSSYAPSSFIDRGRVLGLHREGATIILRAAQRWSDKLRCLCARLEWDFGFPVQANVYLTPASRKSTPPHWDTHDLFILQVAGTKRWRLFASDYSLPLDSQRFSSESFSVGFLTDEIDLDEGHILYLPRGIIHEPVAQSYSIHISLGVLVSRWTDLLLNLVEAAGEQRGELREAVPLRTGQLNSGDVTNLVQRLMELVALLQDRASGEEAVRRYLESLLSQHGDYRRGQLHGMARGGALSRLSLMRRVESAYLWMEAKAGRLVVHWRRGQFSAPAAYAPFLEAVLAGKTFAVADAPACGNEEERLAFCEALVKQGLLEVLSI